MRVKLKYHNFCVKYHNFCFYSHPHLPNFHIRCRGFLGFKRAVVAIKTVWFYVLNAIRKEMQKQKHLLQLVEHWFSVR